MRLSEFKNVNRCVKRIDDIDKIKLKTNLTKAISNKSFTLSVPRGSTNSNYTWGEMELTELDTDTYQTTSTVDMSQQHKIDLGSGMQIDIPTLAQQISDAGMQQQIKQQLTQKQTA